MYVDRSSHRCYLLGALESLRKRYFIFESPILVSKLLHDERQSVVSCGVSGREEMKEDGIVEGHAYQTRVFDCSKQTEHLRF